MSEENIFRPSTTRRAVTSSGLPLSHYFTPREMKQFLEDSDTFWDLYIAPERVTHNENSAPMEDGPEEPSKDNRQKYTRRIRRRTKKRE